MASTSDNSVELQELLLTTIPERDDKQLKTAFYKKTYTSGKIRFINGNTPLYDAKFIKINAGAWDNESILQQVAEGVVNKLWRLGRKNLLLSVTSGADELNGENRKAFNEGIKKMLPGTFLVTGGSNDGVTRLVGDVVHEFNMTTVNEFDQCPSIGIVCLDRLPNKDTIKLYELTRGVFGIDSDGELFTVDNRGERWTLSPTALTEVNDQSDGNTTTSALTGNVHRNSCSRHFVVGDLVQIRNNQMSDVKSQRSKDFLEATIGKIGSIVQVNEDNNDLSIQVSGEKYSCWYKPEAVALMTGERFIVLLKTHFETHEPSTENDELVQAVRKGDFKNVYAIIRQAYTDCIEFTSGSFGVDYSGDFFVVDANGDRRIFTPDDLIKDGNTNAVECKAIDTPHDVAPGDLVMILPTAISCFMDIKLTLGKVGTIVTVRGDFFDIRVCGDIYTYRWQDVFIVDRGRFDLLKEYFNTHKPAFERDDLQQAISEDKFKEVTAIIRKAYKDGERVCEYKLTTTTDDLQDMVHTERYLNPHHHLFVLVEDSTLNKFGGEIEFRAILEKRILSEMIRSRTKGEIYQDLSGPEIPLVNLVLNSDYYTLECVQSAIDKGIPSVVENTTDSDTHTRHDSAISYSKNEIKTKMLPNSNIPNDAFKTFEETHKEKRHLLAVINLSDFSKMVAETLDICWKASSVGMCLTEWALFDRDEAVVLKRLVRADGRRMNSDAFALIMNYFLIRNDEEVVEALIQLDVDMNSAWIGARQYNELCGGKDGLLQRFQAAKDIHTVLWVMDRVKARPVRGKYFGPKAWLPATYSEEKQLHTKDILPYWEYMFILTLLSRKHDMANRLWKKTKHPLFMALIAYNLCLAVKQQTDDKVLMAEMTKNMSEWSTVAIDCLNECYQNWDQPTYVHLTMTMPFWYTQSCLDLAVQSRNKEFLAQQACRNLVSDVWNGQRMDDTLNKLREQRSDTDRIKFFLNKMQAPKTKFAYNVISHLVFLNLFAYVLLFDLTSTVSTKEFVLMTWVLTILVEEIRQMHQIYHMPGYEKAIRCMQRIRKLKSYFSEGWNCIDLFTIAMFLLGFGLRFIQFRDTSYDWPRVVLAVDFIAFFFRLAHIFSVRETLGPKLIMIRRMVQDLMYFLVIMAVFLLAYAIASCSILYPNAPLTWKTARQITWKPYWHLYGELFLEDMEDSTDCGNDTSLWTNGTSPRCPTETGRFFGPILMGVYLLFSNILLLNLLIAIFSNTFTKIHEESDKIWCFQRYVMTKEYALRPVICPPVNVFWHIYQLFQCCLHKCTHELLDDPFHVLYDDTKSVALDFRRISLSEFMKGSLSTYLKRKETDSNDSMITTANEKLDDLKNNAKHEEEFRKTMITWTLQAAEREDEFRRLVVSLQAQLNKMQESIDNLHRKKTDSEHKADEKTEP
ncbi:transient receptor potential cation channel subfamily M member 8-like [Dreissena polymorpha]|nr:transient receptor potential cation channel subfamily M member 8-like [Dreissena polymorpha]